MAAPRFLYGDSQPFAGGYDFLAALRQFVTAASRALALGHEADGLESSLGDRAQEHLYAIDAIQSFFGSVSDAITERAARSGAPQIVGPYASELLERVEALAAQAKAGRARELDGASAEVTAKIRERRAEIRKVVAEYLLTDPLPVLSWALSLSLSGTSPSGQVALEHPADVSTSFALEVARDPSWSRPRRVGDLAPGLTLQVGYKKAFLRSSLHPDVVVLDELVIAALEIGPDSMELHLRRRLDAPRDSFVVTVDPDAHAQPVVKITRFDERSGASEAPFESQGDEARRVLELVTVLRGECAQLLASKKRLLGAQLDGHDVFERNLVSVLLQRIAERLGKTAQEVSRHSPNPEELSLKLEREGGRREELYLKKAELVALVTPLPPEAQQLFSQLAFMPVVAAESVEIDVEPPIELPRKSVPPRPSAAPPPPKRKW